MSETPLVTVIMPVRNEVDFIERAVSSVISQDYPSDRIEILIADGDSTDGTREKIEDLGREFERVRLIENPGRIVPTGWNAAMKQARGSVIVRVDGHCEIEQDYLSECVRLLREREVECVGGPIETIGLTNKARAIAVAMSSRFGVGDSAFRTTNDREMIVDTVAFPAFPRGVIEATGKFDEELVRNQDDEYNYRLRKLGGRILLSPTIRSRYYSRSSLRTLFRQYLQYGYYKVRVMQKHPAQMRWRQFVPPLFVSTIATLALLALFDRRLAWVLAGVATLYVAATVGVALISGRRSLRLAPFVAASFVAIHVGYGIGFIAGMFRFWNRWRSRANQRVGGDGPLPTAEGA